MKLFKKQHFVWTEPWFFCQRIRGRGDWVRMLIPALLAGVGVSILLTFSLWQRGLLWPIPFLGLAVALVVQLGMEAAIMRRDITIFEDSVEAFGNAGQFTSYHTFPLEGTLAIEIRRSTEIGFPFAMLVMRSATQGTLVGIPSSIRLERLAQWFHDKNLPVNLSDWSPSTDPDLGTNEYLYAPHKNSPLAAAQIESIPEKDRNLTQWPEMVVALLFAAWPFLIWLGLASWAGFYTFQNWRGTSFWIIACGVIAAFASLTIPFGYFALFGDFLSSHHLIAAAKKRVRARGDSLIKSLEGKIFAVEMIERATWTQLAPKVTDFGFLVVEPAANRILFEGNKERWILPYSAIRLCKIEEIQYGTAGDSVSGELRCYVVLILQKSTGPFEIGLRPAEKEMGKNTDTRRMRKAVELYGFLTSPMASL